MSLPENVIRALRNEKGQIDEMVAKLSDRCGMIGKLLRSEGQTPRTQMRDTPAVRDPICTQPVRHTRPARIGPKPAHRAICLSSAPNAAKTRNTRLILDMARIVIRNAGRPLAAQAVPEKIRGTFGIVATGSLPQLLTKRARSSRSGFYLTADNLIGLIDMAPVGSTPRP
jgi:hypothetical protein